MSRIIKQNYLNECGPCCIAFLYNKNNGDNLPIDQYDITKNQNLPKEGFNINQMENAAKELGICLESYNADINDLKLNMNKYIIALTKNIDNYSHYVVIRPLKNNLIIIDSAKELHYKISYEEFNKMFLNVILIPKYTNYFKKSEKINLFKLDRKYFWFYLSNILLFVFINGLNLIINLYLKYIFDKQYFYDLNKVIYFSIVISIVSLTTMISNYLSSIISLKYKIKITNIIINKYFFDIFSKDYFDISLLNKNELLYNQNIVLNYISFLSEKKIGIINNSILLISSLLLLIIFNRILFLLAIATVFMNIFFYLFSKKIRIRKNIELKNNINKLNETLLKSINFYDEIRFRGITDKHLKSINKRVITCNENSIKNTINNENFNLLTGYFNKLFFFIFVISILYFLGNNVMSGLLFFLLQLVSYLNQSSISLIAIFHRNNEMNSEIKILKRIENIKNINQNETILSNDNFILKIRNFDLSFHNLKVIKNLNYVFDNNTLITGRNGVGKTTLLKSIMNKNSDRIFINDTQIKDVDISRYIHYYNNEANMLEKILYKNINPNLELDIVQKFINEKKLSWIINEVKIDLENYIQDNGKQISLGQKQIIQFISLFYDDSKYLLLDEVLSNVKDHISLCLISELIKHSKSKNQILIFITHNDKIQKLFPRKLKIGD